MVNFLSAIAELIYYGRFVSYSPFGCDNLPKDAKLLYYL